MSTRQIRVKYAVGDLPARCRAGSITVVVDVNDDTSAGISNQWKITSGETVARVVEVPPYFRGKPDVATAITVSEQGRVSLPARVLVERR